MSKFVAGTLTIKVERVFDDYSETYEFKSDDDDLINAYADKIMKHVNDKSKGMEPIDDVAKRYIDSIPTPQ